MLSAKLVSGIVVAAAGLSVVASGGAAFAAATPNSTSCRGPNGVTHVSYTITPPGGPATTVTTLHGNLGFGDTVTAHFTVPQRCAPARLSLASYDSFFPITDLADQMLFSSATGSFAAGAHTLTARVPPAPSGPGTLTITGSMEGNLPVSPGDTLKAGYDFTMPGSHPAATVRVTHGTVALTVNCPDGSSVPLTITLPDHTYTDPANSASWFPSGDQSSPLVWQGSATVPAGLCGGHTGHAPAGATFTADFHSTDTTSPLHVRFHYADNTAGSWSGTASTTPPGPPHFQMDFVTGPVLQPPFYGKNVISAGHH